MASQIYLLDAIATNRLTGELVVTTWDNEHGVLPVFQGSFVDGIREGRWCLWDIYGRPRQQEEYHKGLRHGEMRVFDVKSGTLSGFAVFSNGVQVGKAKWWYNDGTPMPEDKAPKKWDL